MYNMLCRVKLIIREGSAMQRWVFVVGVFLFVLFCFISATGKAIVPFIYKFKFSFKQTLLFPQRNCVSIDENGTMLGIFLWPDNLIFF